MRIVICDDLHEERSRLKGYIRRLEKDDNLELEITEYSSAEALLEAYPKRTQADVMFLDVYMSGLNGVELAARLKELGYEGRIVFCTTSLDHAVESYKLKADGYLVKPYSYEDFLDAIWRCRQHLLKSQRGISFVSERIEYNIPLSKISFIETAGRACAVHFEGETLTTYKKISDFEAELKSSPAFLKVGRCFLVNMQNISRIEDDCLILKDKNTVPLPTRDKKRLTQEINNWFWAVARGAEND